MNDLIPLQTRCEKAWNVYVQATRRAQRSLAIEDGIAAGRAYRAFLEAYLELDEKRAGQIQTGARQ